MNYLAASILAYYYCGIRQSRSRASFAVLKRIAIVRESSRSLLDKFIPQAVFAGLSTLPCGEIGAPIDHCIVMFCSLHPQAALQDSFSAPLFRRLDAAAQRGRGDVAALGRLVEISRLRYRNQVFKPSKLHRG